MARRHTRTDKRRWQRVRQAVSRRDGFHCQKCGKSSGRLEVHLFQALKNGGAPYDLANRQAFCRGYYIFYYTDSGAFACSQPEQNKPSRTGGPQSA